MPSPCPGPSDCALLPLRRAWPNRISPVLLILSCSRGLLHPSESKSFFASLPTGQSLIVSSDCFFLDLLSPAALSFLAAFSLSWAERVTVQAGAPFSVSYSLLVPPLP